MLLEKKQERLLVAVQTHFVSRHFCLHVLREMRLSKLKALAQTDFRDLLREDHNQSQENENPAAKDQRKVGTTCCFCFNWELQQLAHSASEACLHGDIFLSYSADRGKFAMKMRTKPFSLFSVENKKTLQSSPSSCSIMERN